MKIRTFLLVFPITLSGCSTNNTMFSDEKNYAVEDFLSWNTNVVVNDEIAIDTTKIEFKTLENKKNKNCNNLLDANIKHLFLLFNCNQTLKLPLRDLQDSTFQYVIEYFNKDKTQQLYPAVNRKYSIFSQEESNLVPFSYVGPKGSEEDHLSEIRTLNETIPMLKKNGISYVDYKQNGEWVLDYTPYQVTLDLDLNAILEGCLNNKNDVKIVLTITHSFESVGFMMDYQNYEPGTIWPFTEWGDYLNKIYRLYNFVLVPETYFKI